MSNSNYSIGLQRLKPVHTAYGAICNCMPIRKLFWAQYVNGRVRDVCLLRPPRRWQFFSRRDVGTSRDRDVETKTTTLT